MKVTMKKTMVSLMALGAIMVVEAKTVALWTMASEWVESEWRLKCSIDPANDLKVANAGCVQFPAQTAGWTEPPNPDTTPAPVYPLAGSTCFECTDVYRANLAHLTGEAGEGLISTLSPTNDFTFEGYVKYTGFGPGSNNRLLVFCGTTGKGSWFLGASPGAAPDTHEFRVRIYTADNSTIERSLSPAIPDSSLLDGRFRHFALVFKYDYNATSSAFRFYLDGIPLGQCEFPKLADSSLARTIRLFGTGTSVEVGNNLIGQAYYWRVSDKALRPQEFLREGGAPWTLAYWPMNIDGGDTARCAVSPFHNLVARTEGYGGVKTAENDVGWATPPNFALDAPLYVAPTASAQKVVSEEGAMDGNGQYRGVLQGGGGAQIRDLVGYLSRKNDFTVEFWYRPTQLPASGKNQLFFYMTYGRQGGWVWNLYGNADGSCHASVNITANSSEGSAGSHQTVLKSGEIRAADLLGRWNHYALVFDYDNGEGGSEWRFYLNGCLMGRSSTGQFAGEPLTTASPGIQVSGCTSVNAQQMVGDTLAWRISRRAVPPSELLVDYADSPLVSENTAVYTSFEKVQRYNLADGGYSTVLPDVSDTVADLALVAERSRAWMVDGRRYLNDAAHAETNGFSMALTAADGKPHHRYFGYTIPGNELNHRDFTVEMIAKFPLQTTSGRHYVIEKSKSGKNMCDWALTSSGLARSLHLTLNCDSYSWAHFDTGKEVCGDGKFHHVAVVYNAAAGEITLYVDYVPQVTKPINLAATANTSDTTLYCGTYPPSGGYYAQQNFEGLVVDAFRVTRGMLGVDEIMCPYRAVSVRGTVVVIR